MPGRSTFTATDFGPSGETTSAWCTCAIDAAATAGPSEMNNFSSGAPSASSMLASASACGNGVIRSCSNSRSRANAMPTTSGRVARNCPSFT